MKIFLLLAAIGSCFSLYGEGNPTLIRQDFYGGASGKFSFQRLATYDLGAFTAVGEWTDSGTPQIAAITLSAPGGTIISQSILADVHDFGSFKSFHKLPDGGWVGTGQGALVATDANFNKLWMERFEEPVDKYTKIYSSVVQNDGILVYSARKDTGYHPWIRKLSFTGNTLWTHSAENDGVRVFSIVPTANGFVGAGWDIQHGEYYPSLYKLNDKGEITGNVLLNGAHIWFKKELVPTKDGSWIGWAGYRLFKFDADLNVKWHKDFAGSVHTVFETQDGHLIAVVDEWYKPGEDVVIEKLTARGEGVWELPIAPTAENQEIIPLDGREVQPGKYFLVGTTEGPSNNDSKAFTIEVQE